MKKKQTNYLEKATNRFVKELRRKGIEVKTLEHQDNGKSTITFIPRIKLRRIIMVKFILKEADENSRIYKTGFIISPIKVKKKN